jgi:hypothetical protein
VAACADMGSAAKPQNARLKRAHCRRDKSLVVDFSITDLVFIWISLGRQT